MNRYQKIKSSIIVGFVLIVMSTFTILTDMNNYYEFYKKEKPKVTIILDKFCKLKPISMFGKYTGFETGYGFFGPNVSSDFIFDIHIYNEKGKLIETLNVIPTKSKEGRLRLSCINNMFLDKLGDIDKKYDRYLDIVMEQIIKKIKENYPKNHKVEMKMYLYEYPTIQNFNKDNIPKKVMIKKYVV